MLRLMSQTRDEYSTRRWQEQIAEWAAGDPFALADDGGEVAVSPSLLRANSTYVTLHSQRIVEESFGERTERNKPYGPRLQWLLSSGSLRPEQVRFTGNQDAALVGEELIPPGKRLFALGMPQPWNGRVVLGPAAGGYTAITTLTRDELTGRQLLPGARRPPRGLGYRYLALCATLALVGYLIFGLAVRHALGH